MTRTARMLSLAALVMLLGAAGCSSLHQSDSDLLQGTWEGREIGGDNEGVCYLTFRGSSVEFLGADTNEWIRGVFSVEEYKDQRLMICLATACSHRQYIGRTAYAIYRLERDTLIVAGNEPGNPEVPANFEAPGARLFEFWKE